MSPTRPLNLHARQRRPVPLSDAEEQIGVNDGMERHFAIELDSMQEICTQFKIDVVQSQIDSCRKLLALNEKTIDVGIVGRFKAGKSSFLNHLSGRTVLPVGVVPVTAIVTQIQYSPEEYVRVNLMNGQQQAVSLSSVTDYVSEAANAGNRKGVRSVEIGLPELKRFGHIRFIDTPGLGSAFKHNTETSLNWLPDASVTLVAISVDPPLSESDLELIEQLRKFTPRIVILLTKSDLVNESQREEITKYTENRLKAKFGSGFEIFPYSIDTKLSEQSRLFEEKFLLQISQNHKQEAQSVLNHKLRGLRNETLGFLRIARTAAGMEGAARERICGQIISGEVHREQEHIRLISRDLVARVRPQLAEYLSIFKAETEKRIVHDVNRKLEKWKMSLFKLTEAYEQLLASLFLRELNRISVEHRKRLLEPLSSAEKIFCGALNDFQNRLRESMEAAFHVQLDQTEVHVEVKETALPDIAVSASFDFKLNLLSFLIPMRIFSRPIHNHFLRLIPREVEKNFSRLASQWAEINTKGIQQIEQDALEQVKSRLGTIEGLLSQPMNQIERLDAAIAKIAPLGERSKKRPH